MLDKEEIIELVKKVSDETWISMKSENITDEETEDETITDESVEVEELEGEKSYSHKPHLASLPYDRKVGRTSDELFERYNACLDGMRNTRDTLDTLRKESSDALDEYRKFQHEKEGLKEQYKNMREDNQKFFDADDKVKTEKQEWLNSAYDRAGEYGLPNDMVREIGRISNLLKDTSWIGKDDQDIILEVSNRIIDWRYTIEKDDNQWGNKVDGIADDIRVLGSNDFFDKDLPKLYKNTHDEGEFAELIDKIDECQKGMDDASAKGDTAHKELKKQERVFTDYHVESERTKLSYVKTGVVDGEVSPDKKATWIKNQERKIQQMEEELY